MINLDRFHVSLDFPKMDKCHEDIWICANKLAATPTRLIYHEFTNKLTEHFSFEEAIMERIGYPCLEKHVFGHKNIIELLNAFEYPLFRHILKLDAAIESIGKVYLFHTVIEDAALVEFIKND